MIVLILKKNVKKLPKNTDWRWPKITKMVRRWLENGHQTLTWGGLSPKKLITLNLRWRKLPYNLSLSEVFFCQKYSPKCPKPPPSGPKTPPNGPEMPPKNPKKIIMWGGRALRCPKTALKRPKMLPKGPIKSWLEVALKRPRNAVRRP